MSTKTTTFLKKRRTDVESNRGPSAYKPNALPLGQTGSQTRCSIKTWCLTSTETTRLIRDGEKGGRRNGGGGKASEWTIYKQFSTHERDGRAVPVIKIGVGHRTMVFIDVFIQRGDDSR